jgi:hypothetical protein
MVIVNKKFMSIWMLSFVLFGLCLNATTSEDIEVLTAFLRIPAAIGANTLGKEPGVAPKIILITSDLIRLSNEILSSVNKRGRYDFHTYDYCWTAYDVKNLITHVKNLWGNESDKFEKTDSKEIKKLEAMTQSLHELILPLVEGISAFLQSSLRGTNSSRDQLFRNRCRAVCSLSRLVDNLIISQPRSVEFYAYVILLLANIVAAITIEKIVETAIIAEPVPPVHAFHAGPVITPEDIPDDSDEDHFRNVGGQIGGKDHSNDPVIESKQTFSDDNCSVCYTPFVSGEQVRRLVCGHLIHHGSKNDHEDCFGAFAKARGISANCPICKGKRDADKEKDIIIQ